MKERPIPFTGEMVRAILDGRKTQTRRVTRDPDAERFEWFVDRPVWPPRWKGREGKPYTGWGVKYPDLDLLLPRRCPYGEPGDRLWVRETWRYTPGTSYRYRATGTEILGADKWRSSRFMPREASRITLEVTGVRVERVQDISEADAIAEGVGHDFTMNAGWPDYLHIENNACTLTQDTATQSFGTLWDSINGKRAPWESNPWVWVVGFKRLP